jgi:hypothetical protein
VPDDTPPQPLALLPASTGKGELVPQANGGALRNGNPGNKGNKYGRPSSVIREALRADFSTRRRLLKRIADNKPVKDKDGNSSTPYTTQDQLKALDLMAKYGLGQPVEVGGPDGSPFTLVVKAATEHDD